MIKVGGPQFLFMCEIEGLDSEVSTRATRINAVIHDIENDPRSFIDRDTFYSFLVKHHLTDLTQQELEYIQEKIS